MATRSNDKGPGSRQMAQLVLAEKRENGSYGFRKKMVPLDEVEEELKAAKEQN